jgi:hypothetical protein
MDVDLIIRDGCVVTASDVWPNCDLAIKARISTPPPGNTLLIADRMAKSWQ